MMHAVAEKSADSPEIPRGSLPGLWRYFREDATSGFLVFLIALPLCLGISLASGFPPVAGVFTAVAGAVITTFISNSELTIKGPAAGLIVIVLGAMQSFGYTAGADPAADFQAYRMAIAVGCVAGLAQIVLGLFRFGALSEFFPTAVVHGMLAAIGFIICLKQLPVVFGQRAVGEPLEILAELPGTIARLNPRIAVIGLVSLAILLLFPALKHRLRPAWLRKIPAQLLVLAAAVPLAGWLGLATVDSYTFLGRDYPLGESFLVSVPGNLLSAVATPDFSAFTSPDRRGAAVWWVVMFALVGSVESLLSAKAVDLVDPWKRKTDMNRDLVAVGVANVAASAVGGLPMISEIVRSKANIDNGARTRFADFWHGIFLLVFVALSPQLIHRIPLAALAAMLVYTGLRLASPREFINVFKIGSEQLLIFVATIVGVLATDLLVGVGIGIGLKFLIHAINGVPLSSFFKPFLKVTAIDDQTVQIDASGSAVFTNWIPFRRQIEQLGLVGNNNVVVNLAGTQIVDHSVMEKLHELSEDFQRVGRRLDIVGLESHRQTSSHPLATRRRVAIRLQRLTLVADAAIERRLLGQLRELGVAAATATPCRRISAAGAADEAAIRIEVLAPPDVASRVFDAIRTEQDGFAGVSAAMETVEVARRDQS